jgi:hypothetical protein
MRPFTIIRWIAAAGCLVFCIKQISMALRVEGIGAAGFFVVGFGSLLAFVLLISPETTGRACEFFSRIFTSIILPDDRNRKPPLSYLLARRYRQQLRAAEAVDEYRKIIHYYPDEQTAYLELIATAQESGDEKLAQKYARSFKSRFKSAVLETMKTIGSESNKPPLT